MNRPAFSLCLCPDSRLLQHRLDALLATHPPAQGAPWQRHVFWADEGLPPAFWEHLTIQGLFATPKALIIRNVQVLPADTLSRLLSPALLPLIGQGPQLPSPLIWPLLCLEVGFEKGKAKVPAHILRLPCYQEAERRNWLDVNQGLTPRSMPTYIQAEASRLGLLLTARQRSLLEEALPPDAAYVSSEMEKLSLCADADGRLSGAMTELVGQAQELSIFELLRFVQQNNQAPAAWRRILENRLAGENMVFAFTAILLREARILWQSLAGPAPALPPQVAMQKRIAAQALGFAGIARLWDLALIADKGIKSGERSPDQAFELLAADLFLLFGGRASR